MFVDEVVLKVKAGDGGNGCTSFRREKYVPMGGPNGGNGGKGSSIIFKVDKGLHTLLDLKYQKEIKGKKGENGKTFIFEGGSVKDLQEFLENCSLNENTKITKFSIFVPETEQEKKDRILKEELLLLSKKFNVSLEDIVKKIGEAK